jgi:predicted enzyme related to lactoylglutathione lyase
VALGFKRDLFFKPLSISVVHNRLNDGGNIHMANLFVHNELNTTDPEKAKAFYGQLFSGWKLEETPMPTGAYTMIRIDKSTGGGIMKHPMPGQPSIWIPYIQVEDLAGDTAKAKALGGTVIRDVTEIPGMGSFSIILDPTGAAIGLWQAKTA